MDIAVSNRVIERNSIGQFAAACEKAGHNTVKIAVERGAKLSKSIAPSGTKPDPRTIKLKESISAFMDGATSGGWVATARHALPIEKGAAPHDITGHVSFWWEKEGRMWNPGSNIIRHPGNAAQPYLRPAYVAIMGQIMAIARSEYP